MFHGPANSLVHSNYSIDHLASNFTLLYKSQTSEYMCLTKKANLSHPTKMTQSEEQSLVTQHTCTVTLLKISSH